MAGIAATNKSTHRSDQAGRLLAARCIPTACTTWSSDISKHTTVLVNPQAASGPAAYRQQGLPQALR